MVRTGGCCILVRIQYSRDGVLTVGSIPTYPFRFTQKENMMRFNEPINNVIHLGEIMSFDSIISSVHYYCHEVDDTGLYQPICNPNENIGSGKYFKVISFDYNTLRESDCLICNKLRKIIEGNYILKFQNEIEI